MNAIIYPIQLQRRLDRKWVGRVARELPIRKSRPEGTSACTCGHIITAPVGSQYSLHLVTNTWHCGKCGARWKTEAAIWCT